MGVVQCCGCHLSLLACATAVPQPLLLPVHLPHMCDHLPHIMRACVGRKLGWIEREVREVTLKLRGGAPGAGVGGMRRDHNLAVGGGASQRVYFLCYFYLLLCVQVDVY